MYQISIQSATLLESHAIHYIDVFYTVIKKNQEKFIIEKIIYTNIKYK